MLSRYWLRGRRREGENAYVDRYRRTEWALVAAIFLLQVADLVLTIAYLHQGGEEANPIMGFVLRGGYLWFAIVKLAVAGYGLAFVLLHIRWRVTRPLLVFLLAASVALVAYHLYVRFVFLA